MNTLSETSRKKFKLESINQNTIFENSDALEPEREAGSVLMTFGAAELTTGVLLLPPTKGRKALDPGFVPPTLLVVGAPAASEAAPPPGFDGVQSAFMPHADFL